MERILCLTYGISTTALTANLGCGTTHDQPLPGPNKEHQEGSLGSNFGPSLTICFSMRLAISENRLVDGPVRSTFLDGGDTGYQTTRFTNLQ